jgi:hypothetical protein
MDGSHSGVGVAEPSEAGLCQGLLGIEPTEVRLFAGDRLAQRIAILG